MQGSVQFDAELIRRYDQSGPRYTSYPTAASFTPSFGTARYQQLAQLSNDDPIPRPLSLYVHVPFCDTVCFYCACNKVITNNRRRAEEYMGYLLREMAMQAALYDRDRTVEQLHWGGGTPTYLSAAQSATLMDATRRHFKLLDDDSGDYSVEVDPRSVDRERVRHLRELGFNRFSLGVQDLDPAVQRAVNRVQPLAQNRAVLDACREFGALSVNIDLIYGLPLQSRDSFARTLDRVIEDLTPDRLSIFNYAHLPHLFKPQRQICAEQLPAPEEKLAILQMSVEKLIDAGYVYIGMDHFAKPDDELVRAQRAGNLYRNFQGYSTHADCDLIGMGVSAISKVGLSYCQHEKTLDDYYRRLDAGELPVTRGVQLNADDQLRREVIQQLCCDYAVDIAEFEHQAASMIGVFSFAGYFERELTMLEAMARDGLLSLSAERIEINPRGRLLLRNICMPFDVSLRQANEQPRFSRTI